MIGRTVPILLLLMCGIAAGATPPAEVSRVLKCIDFEERRLGNDEDLPMHWTKQTGPDLPHYVNGKLSNDRAHSGEYSFRFDLNGGSLVYRYDAGQIPVQPGAHYRVEGFVQTTPMKYARARMSAFFTDLDGHPINATIVRSPLYAATAADEDWQRLSVELTADDDKCAFLVIELALLQPAQYSPTSLGERALFPQDIFGTAWWDDITISQVPQVVLSTGRPGNVFRLSDVPMLSVMVGDRFIDDLAAALRITDIDGRPVYQHSGALDAARGKDLGPGRRQFTLNLPDLRPGWYEASLEMTSRGQFLGKQTLRLVRLADDAPAVRPDPRFGLIATGLPFEGWWQLPQILPYLSAGRVKLAVWSSAGDIQQQDSASFDDLLSRLAQLGITPTACLTQLPPDLARRVGGPSWGQLLKSDPEIWRPDLAYLVARHANHLDRWQFGDDDAAADFVEKPEMRKVYAALYREFALLVDKPDLAMPWPAWYDLGGQLPATVALSVPPEVLPAQIPLYMQDILGNEHDGPGPQHDGLAPNVHNLSLSLQLLDNKYGRDVQIRDFAQRVTYALSAGASRIDIPLPFAMERQGDQVVDEPTEMMLASRTLITQLSGAAYKGKVPVADNVDAFLFDRDGAGILVLWSRGNGRADKQLALNLGKNPTRVDLSGNVTPLLRGDGGQGDNVAVDVGPMPFFITDVDVPTAQMRASVGIDRPLLESSFQAHARRLHFSNFGATAISGTFKLTPPAGWSLTPGAASFSLNPGETFDREIRIEFPYNSFAGPKRIDADFAVQGEKTVRFSVPIMLSLGLSDVGMQTVALRDGDDLVVQQMITNYGETPINYTAFAMYPGEARQERLVANLAAGRTTIKLYRFSHVKTVDGAKVRSGLRQIEGTRILNDEVPVQ